MNFLTRSEPTNRARSSTSLSLMMRLSAPATRATLHCTTSTTSSTAMAPATSRAAPIIFSEPMIPAGLHRHPASASINFNLTSVGQLRSRGRVRLNISTFLDCGILTVTDLPTCYAWLYTGGLTSSKLSSLYMQLDVHSRSLSALKWRYTSTGTCPCSSPTTCLQRTSP